MEQLKLFKKKESKCKEWDSIVDAYGTSRAINIERRIQENVKSMAERSIRQVGKDSRKYKNTNR